MNCANYPLLPPRVVATATDKVLKPTVPFQDPVNLPGPVDAPKYGQDITSGVGRAAPQVRQLRSGKVGGEPALVYVYEEQSVGKTEADLKPKMQKLLTIFAVGDKSGMAKRLVDAFLTKQGTVTYFDDPALNAAAAIHPNIEHFCSAALSAPNSKPKADGKIRIHQALKNANWDITNILIPTDLGVPAFNKGSKLFTSEDFSNGLGLMINGVQHAYVLATNYFYDKSANQYCISLKYIFYDVFGLDDTDLKTYGATSLSPAPSAASVGITAWWQLQHQFGYAPLVTRIIVEKSYEAPTT